MSEAFSQLKVVSILGFVLLVILIIILRIFFSRRKQETLARGNNLNLLALKKSGMLTPEEIERVSNSIMKQMQQQTDLEKRRKQAVGSDALLMDPEVRRLETQAALGKQDVFERKPFADLSVKTAEPIIEPDSPAIGVDLDTVDLPLDVIQLVDAGLLTPEEVQNIKLRLFEKRKNQPIAD